jgi:hypothetical protein
LHFLVTMATTNLVTNCPKMKSTYLGTSMNKIIILACLWVYQIHIFKKHVKNW